MRRKCNCLFLNLLIYLMFYEKNVWVYDKFTIVISQIENDHIINVIRNKNKKHSHRINTCGRSINYLKLGKIWDFMLLAVMIFKCRLF